MWLITYKFLFFAKSKEICVCIVVKQRSCLLFSLHRSAFVPPPPHLSSSLPVFFLSASGITIKSFTGLSHPMNRVMRICLLNWNSHLLPPRLRPAFFSPPSSFIALSFILVSSIFSLPTFFVRWFEWFIFECSHQSKFHCFLSLLISLISRRCVQ